MQQYIGFKLNENEFTIPILRVREIINTPSVTQLPQSPHYMKGIINLRGNIIPIVDLKELVNMRDIDLSAKSGEKVIVITNENNIFGILVDAITSVINIDEADIEPAAGFMSETLDRVEGIAKFDDRLVILLDTDKLVESHEIAQMDKESETQSQPTQPAVQGIADIAPAPQSIPEPQEPIAPVETVPPIESVAPTATTTKDKGELTLRELHDARDILSRKFSEDNNKNQFLADLANLIDTMARQDYDLADKMISEMLQSSEGSLYNQIGIVTRKLHESLKEFKNALDPRIRQIADEEVPQAVDSLEYVISKTEEAANVTMGMVEKYLHKLDIMDNETRKIVGHDDVVSFLDDFKISLKEDLNEVMVAQEFQDITGQSIRRVIDLVNTIEAELIGLIATFGVKTEPEDISVPTSSEKVTQGDVEDLLKEFGF